MIFAMKKLAMFGCCMALVAAGVAQTPVPRQIHMSGAQAERLISLLATGNSTISSMLRDQHKTEIVLRSLSVMKFSTYKYDESNPYYDLGIYQAWVKLGANDRAPVGEATAIYELLTEVGVTPDMSMQGSELAVDVVDCKVDVTAAVDSGKRFGCDLKVSY
jgi:hypothetical protein